MPGASEPSRYCRRCSFNLRGLTPREGDGYACPECGKAFDPANRRTYRRRPKRRWEKAAKVAAWVVLPPVLVLSIWCGNLYRIHRHEMAIARQIDPGVDPPPGSDPFGYPADGVVTGWVNVDDPLNRLLGEVGLPQAWQVAYVVLQSEDSRKNTRNLYRVTRLRGVTALELNGMTPTHGEWKTIAGLPDLTNLTAGETGMTDADAKALATCTSLQALAIGGTQVTGDGFRELTALPNLKCLTASALEIDDDDLASLVARPGMLALVLSETQLTDRSMRMLSQFRSLEVLQVSRTRVTDAGLAYFAGHPKLRFLDARWTAATEATAEWLEQHLPQPNAVVRAGTNPDSQWWRR